MSDIYQEKRHTVINEVVVGKKCDICSKDIPPTSRSFPRKNHPYFDITTHHSDWGNDSCDSYEHYHACSPACALKFATEYLNDDFDGCHSREIEIKHHSAWFMSEEATRMSEHLSEKLRREWHEAKDRLAKWIIRKAVEWHDRLSNQGFMAYSWPLDEITDYHVYAERSYRDCHVFGTKVEYYDGRETEGEEGGA